MLIPIGFFGAGAAAGAYELISTAYGTGSSSIITFSSIPQTYKHLQLRAVIDPDNTFLNSIGITFNGSTTSYRSHILYGSNNSMVSADSTNYGQGGMFLAYHSTSYGSPCIYPSVTDVFDYTSTSKNKTIRTLSGSLRPTMSQADVALQSGLWMNTAAVTSLEIRADASFSGKCRFSLYGIKG